VQYSSELLEHLYWWLAYYHFVREHESLRVKLETPQTRKGKQRARKYKGRTPAMAAGVTERRWSVMELISYPCPEAGKKGEGGGEDRDDSPIPPGF
jgi:hypothetical protein